MFQKVSNTRVIGDRKTADTLGLWAFGTDHTSLARVLSLSATEVKSTGSALG